VWDGVRAGSAAYVRLGKLKDFTWQRETPNYFLELPDTWEEFRAARPRNVKEALRKCYNSLARDQHVFSFHAVSEASELPEALRRFFRLHRQRALAPELVPHADYFANARARELLMALARTPERAPALRVFELRIGEALVASRVGFLLGDELYLYFSGFDPAWARYSVMTTTVAEAIKWAIERKLRVVNLSAGSDVSKTRWRPTVVTTCGGVLLAPHLSASLKWRLATNLDNGGGQPDWLSRLIKLARRRG
jgi:CelD/BcsL family acetyltransferase involved in cellulose biosynthesis